MKKSAHKDFVKEHLDLIFSAVKHTSQVQREVQLAINCFEHVHFVRTLDLAQRAKDSQKIKKKTKIPRVTKEGWNSQKQLSGPVEKRGRRRKLLYPHPKLSLALVPYTFILK